MKNIRRLILVVSSLVGVWLLVSFGGVMFDSTANASLWTSSLMWSLLSSLIVLPALLMVSLASEDAKKRKARQAPSKQEPFIQEESDEGRTLWPEAEQDMDWPTQEQKQEHVRT